MTDSKPEKFPMAGIESTRIASSEEMNPQVADQYDSIQGNQQPEKYIDVKIDPRQNPLPADFPPLVQSQQNIEEQGQQ